MIGRNRFVKPELLKHRLLRRLQKEFKINFRFCYLGIWTQSDREGRFEWNPEALQDEIDPDCFEGEDFESVLNILANAGFILKYRAEGRLYGWIPRFGNHQAINARETASRLPPPPPAAYAFYEEQLARREAERLVTGPELRDAPPVSDGYSPSSARADASEPVTDSSDMSLEASHAGYTFSSSSRSSSTADLEGRRNSAQALPAIRSARTPSVLLQRTVEVFRQIENGQREHVTREQKYQLQAEMIFIYWCAKFEHPGARLDAKRTARIVARLKENEGNVGEILYALDGAHADDFIMARNEHSQKKRYDGIETVLRDRGQVERFANTRKKYKDGIVHPMIPKLQEAIKADAEASNAQA